MIEFEIDGKQLAAEQGTMVIEAADKAGIYIPRFCYHRKLSIAANCRMCLVEVEKSGKPLPACATPVTAGMKVFTQSPKALAAQRAVMEFLLINHPLDCPICDQGGECELQDLSVGYGQDASRYTQPKRSVKDEDLGPLIASDMTRCIQCTRCVRFGEEIAGMRELGALGRGGHTEIGTYIQHAIKSEISGNIIDICPVGALTSKPFRFTARAWELVQHASIAPHDCWGSNIFIHTRGREYTPRREVMRVVPRDNEAINENWLSDRDRFSYTALDNPERITKPLIRKNNEWQPIEWPLALELIANTLGKIAEQDGAEQIGALISPNATLEECYLLQKVLRGINCNNIDHRLHQLDFSDQTAMPQYPHLGMPIADVENLSMVLLIGSDIRREQPLACSRLHKAWTQGTKILGINPVDYAFNFDLQEKIIVNTNLIPSVLAKILKALLRLKGASVPAKLQQELASVEEDESAKTIAAYLLEGERIGIFLGATALNHPQAAVIRALAQHIADVSGAKVGYLTEGANSAGAWLAGAVPHREVGGRVLSKPGLDAQYMFKLPRKAYLLMNVEPEFDCATPAMALNALQQAELVVCLTPFVSEAMADYADILLPVAPFSETPGTFVNVAGQWQGFPAVTLPLEQARPGWKILRVLGNLLHLDGFDYTRIEEVQQEIRQQIENVPAESMKLSEAINLPEMSTKLTRITEWPMYRADNLVRRAAPLQETLSSDLFAARINSRLAAKLNLTSGEQVVAIQDQSRITLPVLIDDRIADNNVWIPAGLVQTAGFGQGDDSIELQRSI